MTHELKIYPKYLEEVIKENKTFECRRNDRGFQVGDIVILKEWDNITYSGREAEVIIKYILDDSFTGVLPGYVVFSFDLLGVKYGTEVSKKTEMSALDACKWVANKMCYGRYIPRGKEEYVHDDCHNAGMMAIEALQKRIPVKPKEYEDKYYGCPVCGNILMYKWAVYPEKLMPRSDGLPCCLNCLQAIDWGEEE